MINKLDPTAMANRVEQATRRDGPGSATTLERDQTKVDAGTHILQQALGNVRERIAETPTITGKRVWTSREQAGIPQIAKMITTQGVEVVADLIATAPINYLGALVDELAIRMVKTEGQETGLSQLLDLKIVCESGSDLITEYNQRVRSTPARHRQAERIDPKVREALDVIAKGLEATFQKEWFQSAFDMAAQMASNLAEYGADLGGFRGMASQLSFLAWRAINKTLQQFGEGGSAGHVGKTLKATIGAIGTILSHLVPKEIREAFEKLRDNATALIETLSSAEETIGTDKNKVVDTFIDGLQSMRFTLDKGANAVALGYLQETAVGITGSNGIELLYNRRTKELELRKNGGGGARFALGGTMRAYSRTLYGDSKQIENATSFTGFECGLAVAHLGFWASGREKSAARGYIATVSAGWNTFPVVSDQAAFSIEQTVDTKIRLSDEQVKRIEGVLKEPSPTADKWTAMLGKAFGRTD